MRTIFLFGAGASAGCGETNIRLPIGSELFPVLQNKFPATWGRIPHNIDFQNFEEGMAVVWARHSTQIALLMKDMAVYFATAVIDDRENNLYCKICDKLKSIDAPDSYALFTLNYDCLIEIAVTMTGMLVNYFSDINRESTAVYKLHGSCNFISRGISATMGISYTSGVSFDAGLRSIQPGEVRRYCYGNNALYPSMAIYTKGKPVQIGPSVISALQEKWRNSVETSDNIVLVGVNPNLEDSHIWGPLSSCKATVYFCGGREGFEWWQIDSRRSDTYLGARFVESIEDILNII